MEFHNDSIDQVYVIEVSGCRHLILPICGQSSSCMLWNINENSSCKHQWWLLSIIPSIKAMVKLLP